MFPGVSWPVCRHSWTSYAEVPISLLKNASRGFFSHSFAWVRTAWLLSSWERIVSRNSWNASGGGTRWAGHKNESGTCESVWSCAAICYFVSLFGLQMRDGGMDCAIESGCCAFVFYSLTHSGGAGFEIGNG